MHPLRLTLTLFGWLALLTVGVAHAEKVDLPPASLSGTATHIIVGTVAAIYESKSADKQWSTTSYLAEVRIKTVEKGEGLKTGDLVYVRYWHRAWIGAGDPPPTTNGHRGLPKQDEFLRIYLARNSYNGFGETKDGGFDVVGANGFEKLKE